MPDIKTVLRLNAASCLGFGALFAAAPAAVGTFLSATPAPDLLIRGLGILLVVNAIHLILTSWRRAPQRAELLYFAAGDGAWVLGTFGLLAATDWIARPAGIAAALAVAAMVAVFGAQQLRTAARTAGQTIR